MPVKYKRRTVEEEKPGDLNMTPMIDVVFQLLIFFMLTMQFKETEGKLITTLPKDKGLQSSNMPPELNEVRVILCANGPGSSGIKYGSVEGHNTNKGEHEKIDKDGSVVKSFVAAVDCGELRKTEDFPDRVSTNRQIYQQIAKKAKELHDATPSARDPNKRAPLILDADSEVAYEHVIGVINALRELNLNDVEFAGNPRFGTTYGSFEKSQYNTNKK